MLKGDDSFLLISETPSLTGFSLKSFSNGDALINIVGNALSLTSIPRTELPLVTVIRTADDLLTRLFFLIKFIIFLS